MNLNKNKGKSTHTQPNMDDLFGNDWKKGSWKRSSTNISSLEFNSTNLFSFSSLNNCTFVKDRNITTEELINILDSVHRLPGTDDQIVYRGEAGLKEWLKNNVISNISSLHIRKFLVLQLNVLSSIELNLLIETFQDFLFHVSHVKRKRMSELVEEDFSNKDLYEDYLTSKFNTKKFNEFYKFLFPFSNNKFKQTRYKERYSFEHPSINVFLKIKHKRGNGKRRVKDLKYAAHSFLSWTCTVFKEFSDYTKENIPLSLIQPEHLQEYRNYLLKLVREENRTPYYCKKHLVNIKHIFQTLYQNEYLITDITRGVSQIKADEYFYREIPTDEQLHRFFQVIEAYSDTPELDKLAFGLMLHLGFRVCELLNLDWENFNFSMPDVRFLGKYKKVHTLPLPSIIKQYINEIPRKDKGPVFTLSMSNFERQLRLKFRIFKLVAGWELEGGPHLLRHAFVTKLSHQERDLRILRLLARHVALSTTTKYIHRSSDELKNAVNQINYF